LDLTSYVPIPIEKPTSIGCNTQHELPGTGAGNHNSLQQSGPFIQYMIYLLLRIIMEG
ncbi:7571_t:CDS:1, partial [Funneliformis geosporum]